MSQSAKFAESSTFLSRAEATGRKEQPIGPWNLARLYPSFLREFNVHQRATIFWIHLRPFISGNATHVFDQVFMVASVRFFQWLLSYLGFYVWRTARASIELQA